MGAQRPTCLLIGPAGGLSSAIFAKGSKGTSGRLHGQGGGPAHSDLSMSAGWFLLADTCGFGERAQRPQWALSAKEAGKRRSRGLRDSLLIPRQHCQCFRGFVPGAQLPARSPLRDSDAQGCKRGPQEGVSGLHFPHFYLMIIKANSLMSACWVPCNNSAYALL